MNNNFPTVTSPWDHQRRAFDFMKEKSGGLLAMDMGTGKSMTAVALALHWGCKKILILCPLSVVNVWPREFGRHSLDKYRVMPLNKGSVVEKTDRANSFMKVSDIKGQPCVVVVNYESAWREPFRSFALKAGFDLLIMDESHRIKSAGGSASRFCYLLGKKTGRKLGLTGTPAPHSPLDLYGQFRAIDSDIFGFSFTRFKKRYAQMGGYLGYQVLGYKNKEEMNFKYKSITFEVSKEEALDLPEVTHIDIPCELNSKAMKVYQSLESNFYAEVDSGEITAPNCLVKLLRLQQITSGHITNDEGEVNEIDNSKAKALEDLLEDTPPDQCTVVFCRFRKDLDKVQEIADRLGKKYGEVSGTRKDLTDNATIPDKIQILGVQLQSGGVGIDLTKAQTGVYYSIGFSLGDYLQSVARLHRPGQDAHVTFYHLVADKTIDRKVYRALQNKQDVVNSILKGDFGNE